MPLLAETALPPGMGYAAHHGELRAARLRVRFYIGRDMCGLARAFIGPCARGLCLCAHAVRVCDAGGVAGAQCKVAA